MVAAVLVNLLASLAPVAASPPRVQERVEAWREDVLHVLAELERLHPDPYFTVSREEFREAADDLVAGIPGATDDEVVVGLMRLFARISSEGRDGHTAVWPIGFRLMPIQLYRFSNGWFVVRAAPAQQRLVGARLLRVGDVEVEEACGRIAPLLSRDNESDLLAKTATMLLATELLHVLEIAQEPARARLVLRGSDGESLEVELAGQTPEEYSRWNTYPPVQLPPDDEVPWLRGGGGPFWMEVLQPGRTLYVRYAQVRRDDGRGHTLAEFAEELVRRFEEEELERVVIDVRRNRGGDNTTFWPLIDALRSSEAIDRRGALFVLTGRETFSAAGNFVTAVQQRTNALLVGEPSGGAPNQFGDTNRVELRHHPDVLVLVSTRYHEFGGPDDDRLSHEPDLPAALSAEDYFRGRDPVLDAAVAFAN